MRWGGSQTCRRSTAWPAVEGDRMYADANDPGRRSLLVSGADMQASAERRWEPALLPGQAAAQRSQPKGQPAGQPSASPVTAPVAASGGQSIGALRSGTASAGRMLL